MGRLVLVLALFASGCITDSLVRCGDELCPTGSVCTTSGCADPDQVTACASLAEGDTCSTTSIVQGYCTGGACRQSQCGNGKVEYGEVCDDGNLDYGDGCSARCDSDETCGNGIVDVLVGEQCDSGVPGLSNDGCTSTCQIEIEDWHDVTPPPLFARLLPAAAYDSDRHRVVLFGGTTGTTLLADTWEWDGTAWVQRFATQTPPARLDAAMGYDPARHVTVMFGGRGLSGAILGDMWEWNGTDWIDREYTTAPPARYEATLTYDPTVPRLLLFGGHDSSGVRADTWVLDGQGWTHLTPATSPPARDGAVAVTDPQSNSIVLFGGENTSLVPFGDTWQWNGSTWSSVTGTQPQARRDAQIAYDVQRGHAVLYGGLGGSGSTGRNDMWLWSNGAWTSQATTTGPDVRFQAVMATDPIDGVMMFAGENNMSAETNETWRWTTTWANVSSQQVPAPRYEAASTFDLLGGATVVFGGCASAYQCYGDTWLWRGRGWRPGPPGPAERGDAALAFDRDHGCSVLFGGYSAIGPLFDDTWTFDGTTWVDVSPTTRPGARRGHSLAYDELRHQLVLIGGNPDASMWLWDGMIWSQAAPAHLPPTRYGAGMAFDAARGVIVLFGGQGQPDILGDTWTWDGTDWTQQAPATSPPPRVGHQLVYDERTHRVVMFGGSDTWAWDGTSWTLLALPELPPSRDHYSMVYDAVHAAVVMYGGRSGSVPSDDVWIYDFESAGHPADQCIDSDTDGDGLAGCADPDCTARCTPLCRPGEPCDPNTAPRCGDGTCSPLEDHALCPQDCP